MAWFVTLACCSFWSAKASLRRGTGGGSSGRTSNSRVSSDNVGIGVVLALQIHLNGKKSDPKKSVLTLLLQ